MLARRMGYKMRPIARRTGATRQGPSSPRMTGQGYRAPFRPGRDYAKVKCFSCGHMGHRPGAQNQIHRSRSGRMVGTHSLMVHDSALMDQHRATTYRPGPHPHRSARNSFGPRLILIHRINKYRSSFCHRKFCPVRGSGYYNIDRCLLSS